VDAQFHASLYRNGDATEASSAIPQQFTLNRLRVRVVVWWAPEQVQGVGLKTDFDGVYVKVRRPSRARRSCVQCGVASATPSMK
jgi:hypothetical protein